MLRDFLLQVVSIVLGAPHLLSVLAVAFGGLAVASPRLGRPALAISLSLPFLLSIACLFLMLGPEPHFITAWILVLIFPGVVISTIIFLALMFLPLTRWPKTTRLLVIVVLSSLVVCLDEYQDSTAQAAFTNPTGSSGP